jgi:DNA repair exonuclease SbcCD ATPase subunit
VIVFERVRYKNFLATGDVSIELALNENASTLIIGKNGAGKSTMTEALCFALFGRALRNINKPALINSTNKKDTVVELWFTIDQTRYHIKRGMKPTVFQIYVDDVLLPAPASLADYQTLLESTILKINYKSFMQIVVLGSASFVPFMRLTPTARREIIEDLLDIEIFSAMSGLTKGEIAEVKNVGDQLTMQRVLLEEQLRMAESFTTQLVGERDDKLATLRTAMDATQTQIDTLREQETAWASAREVYTEVPALHRVASTKRSGYATTHRAIASREKKLEKERVFYTTHDECPTCEQSITDSFKQARFLVLTEKEAAAQTALTQCQTLMDKYEALVDTHQIDLDADAELHRQIALVGGQVPIHTQRLRELEAERQATLAPAAAPVDVDALQTQQQEILEQHTVVAARRSVLDTAMTLLKDSGIKARVIKHYLPIINKHINYYLTAMDFPIHFTLNEEFKEQIQSRHRDDFCYESFSEGEKKRIDLALLLTWRSVARLKNSASCNVLVLDEVFDSSLDINGTEEFLKIIHDLEHANVFVISHKTDSLIDKFHHVITFEKQRGFSSIKA